MRFNLKGVLLVVTLAAVTAAIVAARGMIGVIYVSWLLAVVLGVVAWWSKSGTCVVMALVLFLSACAAVPITYSAGHPIRLWRLDRIHVGMAEEQVEGVLGMPTSIDGLTWVYSSDWTFCYVTVTFSDDHRVREVVHDH